MNYFKVDPHENNLHEQKQAEGAYKQHCSQKLRVSQDSVQFKIIAEYAQQDLSFVFNTGERIAYNSYSEIDERPDEEIEHIPVYFGKD